jgi:hypothetical protein
MPGTRNRGTTRLTDEQIRERIGHMVEQPSKTGYLTSAVFALSVLALALSGAFPPAFKDVGAWAAKVLWVINLIWTLVAAFGWKSPLTDWESKHLSEKQQHRHSRLGTIWFRVWKGGYLVLVSIGCD